LRTSDKKNLEKITVGQKDHRPKNGLLVEIDAYLKKGGQFSPTKAKKLGENPGSGSPFVHSKSNPIFQKQIHFINLDPSSIQQLSMFGFKNLDINFFNLFDFYTVQYFYFKECN
jgi:hypothetical protein